MFSCDMFLLFFVLFLVCFFVFPFFRHARLISTLTCLSFCLWQVRKGALVKPLKWMENLGVYDFRNLDTQVSPYPSLAQLHSPCCCIPASLQWELGHGDAHHQAPPARGALNDTPSPFLLVLSRISTRPSAPPCRQLQKFRQQWQWIASSEIIPCSCQQAGRFVRGGYGQEGGQEGRWRRLR